MHIWLNKIKQTLSLTRILQVLLALYVIYLLLAYFAVNPIAQKLIPSIAKDSLSSEASVGKVSFDPITLTATINDFALKNNNAAQLMTFEKLLVDFEITGIFKRAWRFKQVALIGPEVTVSVNEAGQLNWQALLDQLNKEPSPPSDTIPRLMIEQIGLAKGKFIYADYSEETPINTTLTPLGFQLNGFSTLPQDRGDYLIAAVFADDGGRLRWKGDMGVNPVASTGQMTLEGVHLANMLELVQGLALPINITQGDVQASFNYHFSLPKSVPTVRLQNIQLSLDALAGKMQDGTVLSLDNTSLTTPSLRFIKREQPTLQIDALDYSLDALAVKQSDQMQLTLNKMKATLPKLAMRMGERPELLFDQLNFALSDIAYQQGEQFSITAPTLTVDQISYNLSEQLIKMQQANVADIRFFETTLNKAAQSNRLAKLDAVNIAQSEVMLNEKHANVGQVLLKGFDTKVIRNQQGNLNWLNLFAAQDGGQAVKQHADVAENQTQQATPWALQVNAIKLNDANVHVVDNSTNQSVNFDIVKGNIEVQNASLDFTKPLPVNASFRVKQGGQFTTKGKVWPSPFQADLRLRLSRLSLKPFAPYVNQLALLKLNNGAAHLSGQLNLQQKKQFAMAFNGGFSIQKLSVVEELDNKPFLSWEDVNSNNVKFSLGPDQLHVGTLALIKPAGKFIINADKSLNVQQILRSHQPPVSGDVPTAEANVVSAVTEVKDTAAPSQAFSSLIKPESLPTPVKQVAQTQEVSEATPDSQHADAAPFPVTIDRVTLQDAQLEFADLSLITPFGTNIHSLNGVVNGLATQADKVAQVELDGKVDAYGLARIRGALQPFQATDFTDIKLAFTNLDMSKLTPYSGKFAGRRIDSGKLSVNLGYQIKKNQLVGENKFVVNKIKLGEKVDSPDAADLPLDLAIAILEDSDGVIDLDLPISGSLDDPTFSYSSIIWKAFTNVLTKIVTAPFRALGKLFGGDGEDFDGITFEAGLSEISPPEQEKLVKISEALSKRQNLSLGVVPVYHQQADTKAIKQSIYRQQVAEAMEITLLEGQKAGPVDLSNASAQKAIIQLHDQLTKKSFIKRMADKFDEREDGYFEKAQRELLASIEVTEKDLVQLAQARGQAIYDELINHGVAQTRLSIVAPASTKDKNVIQAALTLDVKKVAANESIETSSEPSPAS